MRPRARMTVLADRRRLARQFSGQEQSKRPYASHEKEVPEDLVVAHRRAGFTYLRWAAASEAWRASIQQAGNCLRSPVDPRGVFADDGGTLPQLYQAACKRH